MSRSQEPVGLYFQFRDLSGHRTPGEGWEDSFSTRFAGEAVSADRPWGFRETLQSALGFRMLFQGRKGAPVAQAMAELGPDPQAHPSGLS